MGWSSWNGNGGPTTPANIRDTAARLEHLGLRELGYLLRRTFPLSAIVPFGIGTAL
jgi:hypothetical protein